MQSRREELSRGLLRYANLPNDWDGDDGHAPTRQDIKNAIKFMDFIPAKGIVSAELMVAGDGDVGFKWETKDTYIEVGFCHGDISFYGKTAIGEKAKGDERFNEIIPKKLAKLMNIVFSG